MFLKVLEHKADLFLELFGSIRNLLGFSALRYDLNCLTIDLGSLRIINRCLLFQQKININEKLIKKTAKYHNAILGLINSDLLYFL